MKTLYKRTFLLIALFMSVISFSQQKQLDTLNYIKQFETNKASYIGKPFSVLLNDMTKIKPKTVWFTPLRDKNNIKISRFKFIDKDKSFSRALTLSITWKDFIPYSDVKYLYLKNKFYFTDEEKNFYGTKIIQDITVYR
ncbi:hypothetical protein IF128_03230 [Empedobacter stercoris]|uniref:Uncharacterized protein n=1 Tax=Empedobacter stercoris TaxID=1628248 RepID=A0ABX1WN23_9FLAO|nr:hypothetical protein [Empedobacter stercoris]MCA4808765.1 hypothetical protein [Empedobacter stercoris]NOJ76102.1 hypothetical protein [Empedobacter stercoris]QNT15297.1 hypothetical protein HNV03_11910 [Empedobacter stercoris]